MCFSTKIGHVIWFCLEVMHLFVTGHAPFFPVGPNSWSAVLWLMINLSTQFCASLWIHLEFIRLSFFCNRPLRLPRPLLVNWHEDKHIPSHTHLTSMTNFSLLGQKPTERPTEWRIELLVAAKKTELPIPSNFHVPYSVSMPCFNMIGSEWGLKMQSEIFVEDGGDLC